MLRAFDFLNHNQGKYRQICEFHTNLKCDNDAIKKICRRLNVKSHVIKSKRNECCDKV